MRPRQENVWRFEATWDPREKVGFDSLLSFASFFLRGSGTPAAPASWDSRCPHVLQYACIHFSICITSPDSLVLAGESFLHLEYNPDCNPRAC